MSEVYIVAVNPGDTLDDFIAYIMEDPIDALDGAKFSERDAEIAELRAEIAALRAQLDAVPIAQLRRQYSIEPMTVHDFGLDAQDVDAWLRSLDGDA